MRNEQVKISKTTSPTAKRAQSTSVAQKTSGAKPAQKSGLTTGEFRRLKKRLAKAEEKNYDHVTVLPCSGGSGWCEIADHSALFYYYLALEQHKRKPNFCPDDDRYCKAYAMGRIRLRDAEVVKRRLEKTNLLKSQAEYGKGIVIFTLNKTITKLQVDELWEREQSRREELQTIVKVDHLAPTFYRDFLDLAKQVNANVKAHMDKVSQTVYGQEMMKQCQMVLCDYIMLTESKEEDIVARWDKIIATVHTLEITLQVLCDIGVWSLDISGKLGRAAVEVRELADEEKRAVEAREPADKAKQAVENET